MNTSEKTSDKLSEKIISGINCDCDDDCRKKARRRLLIATLILAALFLTGYFLLPCYVRIIWLIVTGAGAVLSALLLYLVNSGILSTKC